MKNSTQYKLKILFSICLCFLFINTNAQTVSTLAGKTAGFTDGTGTTALFNLPSGVAVANDGTIYVADTANNCIRKITAAGVVTTLAGSTPGFADGTGATAKFYEPYGVAVDSNGNVYVGDDSNHCVRKITAAGVVSTLAGSTTSGFADGTGTAAKFNRPMGVAVGVDGTVYVADYFNRRVRKISTTGAVTSLAGGSMAGFADGTGTAARFNNFTGVAVAADGTVFVADTGNALIRKITPLGVVTTYAGNFGREGFLDGTGTSAWFYVPSGVAVTADGTIYVADKNNHRIRKIAGSLSNANFQLKNQILVFPNPTSSIIYFQTTNNLLLDKITITDVTGKIVLEKNNTSNQVNVEQLVNGMYIIKATTGEEKFVSKFLKE